MFDKIETGKYWDEGWKLVEGCTRVSPACDNCWALAMDKRFKGTEAVTIHHERLDKPLKRKKPTAYAIWNDLFHEDVPEAFIDRAFAVMAGCPQHIFIVLTKRPKRMKDFFGDSDLPILSRIAKIWKAINTDKAYDLAFAFEEGICEWPLQNVWLGVTAENQEQADKRIPLLLTTPAAKRIVSVEPMLENVALKSEWIGICSECEGNRTSCRNSRIACCPDCRHGKSNSLDWVICGGETTAINKARKVERNWVISIQRQCEKANVPFYFKKWGIFIPSGELRPRTIEGKEYNETPMID